MINKILMIFPSQRKIKKLMEEIDEQDKQHTALNSKYNIVKKERDLLLEENNRLENSVNKYLDSIRKLRKEIKQLKNKNTIENGDS